MLDRWLERMREIAAEAGLDPDQAMAMTVRDFMRAVAERRPWPKRFTNYEPYGFSDGVRSAWVTYQLDHELAERRCVAVSESGPPKSADRSEWLTNVLRHCDGAKRNSIATMSALGKSSSKISKAVAT